MAEMFHSRNIPVTFLVRESSFWNGVLPQEESEMINRHIREHHIDLRLETELKEVVDDGKGKACAVLTQSGERMECGFVGLTAGVRPNIDFLKDTALEINRGILVDQHLQTNLPDVYAIGDCAEIRTPQPGRRAIEAVWYTGRIMGETLAHTLCGRPTPYQPGIWFNSAKFFDIEYQVYGNIPARLTDEQASLYWEHPSGKKAIRINFDMGSGAVLGFNLMGIRYRHEVCEKWIAQGSHIEEVLSNLGIANFDPEFFDTYEEELVQRYNQQTGRTIQLKKKRGLSTALAFLRN
jgi:NADPH-dependent 2,4-dienoyl-CoA reductase/sulfur reductase-like enzyme